MAKQNKAKTKKSINIWIYFGINETPFKLLYTKTTTTLIVDEII